VRSQHFALLVLSLAVAGCARTSVLPLAADTLQITASAAPACGATGAQSVALHRAAVETLRHNYDRFIIVGQGAQNNVRVINTPPTQATTVGSGVITANGNTATVSGVSTTTYSGGGPMVFGSHDQSLVIKMFRDSDAGAQNAISARDTLGPNWQKEMASNENTCLG
jgi:hypothetical protein